MSAYLKKIGLFFGYLFLVCIVIFGFQNENIRKQGNFKLKKNYRYLQVGHSHAAYAYNDSLIFNYKNLATPAEPYFYTYHKLLKILEQNQNIQIILIEFTNNQIDSSIEKWLWEDKFISKFYPTYGNFLSFDEQIILLKENPRSVLKNFSNLQKQNFKMFLNSNYDFLPYLGGYVYNEANDLEKIKMLALKRKNNTSINHKNIENISDIQIQYLERIVDLCTSNGKKVIFTRSPQHSSTYSLENERRFLRIYNTKFRDIPMLDFNELEIPNYGYKDLTHLNFKGSKIVSKALDSLLKKTK